MPVILTTAKQIDAWMTVPWNEGAALQRPLPDAALHIVARRMKKGGEVDRVCDGHDGYGEQFSDL